MRERRERRVTVEWCRADEQLRRVDCCWEREQSRREGRLLESGAEQRSTERRADRVRADPCQAEEKSCWLISAEEQSRNRELGSASVRVTPESHTDWDVTVRSRVSSRR